MWNVGMVLALVNLLTALGVHSSSDTQGIVKKMLPEPQRDTNWILAYACQVSSSPAAPSWTCATGAEALSVNIQYMIHIG